MRKISWFIKIKYINVFNPTRIGRLIIMGLDNLNLTNVSNALLVNIKDIEFAQWIRDEVSMADILLLMEEGSFFQQVHTLFSSVKIAWKFSL